MKGRVAAVVLAFVGLLLAASVGFAAYYASRDSVGLPVTKLEPRPRHLAPTSAHTTTVKTRPTTTRAATTTRGATTVGDHGGRRDDRSGRGGSGSSGHGGGDD